MLGRLCGQEYFVDDTQRVVEDDIQSAIDRYIQVTFSKNFLIRCDDVDLMNAYMLRGGNVR